MLLAILALSCPALPPQAAGDPSAAAPAAPPLWGDLEPGPHAVGFSNSFLLDGSRRLQMTFEDGTRYAPEPAPRPLLVNLWYPADADEGGVAPMPYGEYLDLSAEDERLARFAAALVAYERRVIAQELFGSAPQALAAADARRLEALLATPTACRRDALPAAGRRPLVVYHAGYGSSFEDNSVLCEYLASHGYVVVGSAFQAADGSSFNVDSRDGSALDVERLVDELRSREEVDAARVAMIGHSGGAHATLRMRARPGSPLDALVSLDTTQDYYSSLDPRWDFQQPVLANPGRMDVPILFCANPHACFDLADRLSRASRWYLTSSLGHNEFITQGVLAAELAAQRAPDDAAAAARARRVRAEYSTLCRFVLAFLDAHLLGSVEARGRLDGDHRETVLGAAIHVEHAPEGTTAPPPYPPGSTAPPTPRQLRPLLALRGAAAAADALRRSHPARPAAPVFHPICGFALVYELVALGRIEDARTMGAVWRDLVPGFTGTFDAIGRYGAGIGRREFAIQCFEALLAVDPDDEEARRRLAGLRAG